MVELLHTIISELGMAPAMAFLVGALGFRFCIEDSEMDRVYGNEYILISQTKPFFCLLVLK